MEGYKTGTEVFITWAKPGSKVKPTEIHIVGQEICPPGTFFLSGITDMVQASTRAYQELADVSHDGRGYFHPIEWMRPVDENPDDTIEGESIMDIAEDIKRLAEEINE